MFIQIHKSVDTSRSASVNKAHPLTLKAAVRSGRRRTHKLRAEECWAEECPLGDLSQRNDCQRNGKPESHWRFIPLPKHSPANPSGTHPGPAGLAGAGGGETRARAAAELFRVRAGDGVDRLGGAQAAVMPGRELRDDRSKLREGKRARLLRTGGARTGGVWSRGGKTVLLERLRTRNGSGQQSLKVGKCCGTPKQRRPQPLARG